LTTEGGELLLLVVVVALLLLLPTGLAFFSCGGGVALTRFTLGVLDISP
jgi:hypothetical protein